MARVDEERVHILGIRHHGPGSARAVRAALDDIKPTAVLIEGPPEADALVGLSAELEPPVALLVYVPDQPSRAAFWPFATFSPEWQAMRWAAANSAEVRFCDLPAAHTLAESGRDPEDEDADSPTGRPRDESGAGPGGPDADDAPAAPAGPDGQGEGDDPGASGESARRRRTRVDPLGVLAEAAGYDDAERWWEDVVEQRDGGGPLAFPAIAEAMTAVREELTTGPEDEREARREAHMRQVLRATLKAGHERIVVVCGAWHVPALRDLPKASADSAILKGLPKVKTATTWIPWSHGRLASARGYRAGVRAPGWYHHLFTAPDRPVERWLAESARRLREQDQPTSTAHVIEAVRLSEGLAALRGRPLAGLDEVAEATTAVLCEGSELRAELVHREMSIGERLGSVPDSTPMVPLQRDLVARQKTLRLKPEALRRDLDLDLRKDNDRARSVLLHRLRLIGVKWGSETRAHAIRSKGTFRESWSLQWEPELDIALIEASIWGTSVLGAATARAAHQAAGADLPGLTGLAERCLLADLADAVPEVLARIAERAAEEPDIGHLMAALPPLARSTRYGSVRRIDADALNRVSVELLRRICVGLRPAMAGLGYGAAAETVKSVYAVHSAAMLLGGDPQREWLDALETLTSGESIPGLIAGRAHRLLHDSGRIDTATLAVRLRHATSRAVTPDRAAAWIEGFLSGSGLLLVHDPDLLRLVDDWMLRLDGRSFVDVLPLLRRTFGAFAEPERRAIGEQAVRLDRADTAAVSESATADDRVDSDRADPAAATVALLLGSASVSADTGEGAEAASAKATAGTVDPDRGLSEVSR